jgi:phospholipid/cholesterol/gamma-HCH transport system permease protein
MFAESRFFGYAQLGYFVSTSLGAFRDRLLRSELVRQIHAYGLSALPVIVMLAAITGIISVTQVESLVGQEGDLAQRLLFFGLFFELAPLITGLVIVARSSAAIASELAVMRVHDEFTALRRMGVPAANYLLLPRIAALAIVMPVASTIFQCVAVGCGWIAVALLQSHPLLEVAGLFFDLASPGLIFLALAKSFTMGLVVGIIATHHGSCSDRMSQAISNAAIQAVGNGLVALFIVDIGFASIAYVLR